MRWRRGLFGLVGDIMERQEENARAERARENMFVGTVTRQMEYQNPQGGFSTGGFGGGPAPQGGSDDIHLKENVRESLLYADEVNDRRDSVYSSEEGIRLADGLRQDYLTFLGYLHNPANADPIRQVGFVNDILGMNVTTQFYFQYRNENSLDPGLLDHVPESLVYYVKDDLSGAARMGNSVMSMSRFLVNTFRDFGQVYITFGGVSREEVQKLTKYIRMMNDYLVEKGLYNTRDPYRRGPMGDPNYFLPGAGAAPQESGNPMAQGINMPGASGGNMPGTTGINMPGSSGIDMPGASGINMPGYSGVDSQMSKGIDFPSAKGNDQSAAGNAATGNMRENVKEEATLAYDYDRPGLGGSGIFGSGDTVSRGLQERDRFETGGSFVGESRESVRHAHTAGENGKTEDDGRIESQTGGITGTGDTDSQGLGRGGIIEENDNDRPGMRIGRNKLQLDTAGDQELKRLLEELDHLTGLSAVKENLKNLVNVLRVRRVREQMGLPQPDMSLHLVFSGNPGTGKTTVARLLAKIYKALGVLSQGQMIEVDRSGLVEGYMGQTAQKTQDVIDSAMGGVLFIDEAYTLTNKKGNGDYGQEAVDTLLKRMEDDRGKFVVIVAGYSEPMEEFLASNPGLRSRFSKVIEFEDYTEEELYEIFVKKCESQDYHLTEDARRVLKEHFRKITEIKDENFANAREVRNFFERCIERQANRLTRDGIPDRSEIMNFRAEDVTEDPYAF